MPSLRATYTNVTATLALVVALSGSAYAATSLTGSDVRDGSLTGTDLGDGSVASRDVRDITGADISSLTSADIGSLSGADLAAGQLAAGPPGPAGPAGAKGPEGATRVVTRLGRDVLIARGQNGSGTASCEPDEVAVGGGAGHSGQADDLVLIRADEPLEANGTPPEDGDKATQWQATALNFLGSDLDTVTLTVHVLCAEV